MAESPKNDVKINHVNLPFPSFLAILDAINPKNKLNNILMPIIYIKGENATILNTKSYGKGIP